MTKKELKALNKEYAGKELLLLDFDNLMLEEFRGESLFDSRNWDSLNRIKESEIGAIENFSYGNTYQYEDAGDCVNVYFTILNKGENENNFDTLIKIEEIEEI